MKQISPSGATSPPAFKSEAWERVLSPHAVTGSVHVPLFKEAGRLPCGSKVSRKQQPEAGGHRRRRREGEGGGGGGGGRRREEGEEEEEEAVAAQGHSLGQLRPPARNAGGWAGARSPRSSGAPAELPVSVE